MRLPYPLPTLVRSDVQRFAAMMELELREHDEAKGARGWVGLHPLRLFAKLSEEVGEIGEILFALYVEGSGGTTQRYSKQHDELETLLHECADVGNIAMMLARAASDWMYE